MIFVYLCECEDGCFVAHKMWFRYSCAAHESFFQSISLKSTTHEPTVLLPMQVATRSHLCFGTDQQMVDCAPNVRFLFSTNVRRIFHMSLATIHMTFVNDTTHQMSFNAPGSPQHGTQPAVSANPMQPVGVLGNISTVSASSNSPASGPGPEGTFQWAIVGTNPTAFINVSYNHPFGSGTTTVTVSCPTGFTAACGSQGPAQTINLNQNTPSLQNHDSATCQITLAGSAAS